jgi:hypothetical protein
MDLALLKQKLGNLNAPKNSGGKTYEKIDYTKVFWKPQVGNYTIRIVPAKSNKQNPFKEVYFHYGFAKGPVLALNNFGEADPIMEFAAKLRQSKDRDNWALAKKLDPKMRVFVPVVVRGEEHLGVRLWEFGKEVYKSLLGFAADEDYGDFTDIQDGFDFKIDAVHAEVAGRKVVSCTLRPRPKSSPISEDINLINKFLEEQPDIMAINRKREYNDIKELLAKWLNPEAEEEQQQQQSPTAPAPTPVDPTPAVSPEWEALAQAPSTEDKSFSLNTNSSDKFDELFQ